MIESNFVGNSSTGAITSTLTDSIALRGIESYFADCGDCTSTRPLFSFIDLIPKDPSDPIPERIIQMLFSFLSLANDLKNISIGNRNPLQSIISDNCKVSLSIVRLLLGGII